MLHAILESLFGCGHRRTTFPLTPRRGAPGRKATYVVCLDCGREFTYDWAEMRVGEPVASRVAAEAAESTA
jgi:hypothetical protein